MIALSRRQMRFFWQGLNRLDRIGLILAALYGLVWVFRAFHRELPLSGFIGFLFLLSLSYYVVRFLGWARARILWSLRNRLIVAYVFIAVVPVLLLLVMAALVGYLFYWQLAAYLISNDIEKRVERVAATAETLALSAPDRDGAKFRSAEEQALYLPANSRADLPGLTVEFNTGQELLKTASGKKANRFAGIVQKGSKLWLMAVVAPPTSSGHTTVAVSVPVSSELMDSITPELGPVQIVVTRLATEGVPKASLLPPIGNQSYVQVAQIFTRRSLSPPANFLDRQISAISRLDAVLTDPRPEEGATSPVIVSFSMRPSQLNQRLVRSLGELASTPVNILLAVGVIFLGIELAALITGIALTRTITHAVADLYRATQYVQAGDLTHQVRVLQRDQLGALGASFNSMTGSISALIEEQRQRQRLENELSIAREVQAQLFPQRLPSLPGIQLEALCRAARTVSGDYYDFLALGPARLGMVIADISGKGISAALLMASLQACLRSQVLLNGHYFDNPAEIVARLNRHLFLNTGDDRYATLFYAVYDSTTRTLRYTNAGHLPPLYIAGDRVAKLDAGGTVVGLFDEWKYEQGAIQIEPGGLLVAYSDGLTEPENVYGEQFGARRLTEVVLRHRQAPLRTMVETVMNAAEEWGGTPEQADDMTVIVARID